MTVGHAIELAVATFLVGTFFGKYILGAGERLLAAEYIKVKGKL